MITYAPLYKKESNHELKLVGTTTIVIIRVWVTRGQSVGGSDNGGTFGPLLKLATNGHIGEGPN
jgi:hypothetical protein